MTVIDELLTANRRVVHRPLPNLPRLNLCIVTCPDPRVDPTAIFDLQPGDAAVVRAAAGRVSPIVVQQLLFLSAVGADYGQNQGSAELVLMTHTDCGIKHFLRHDRREALAAFLGCRPEEIESRAVEDPREAVRSDLELLAANPLLPAALAVTGIVYDVDTGGLEVIERRSPLRRAPS
jgi:carbonic anhydrase